MIWIAEDLGFDPNWLMACIAFESGESFSPSKKNPQSSATGLIQFMEFTAKNLGTTTAALAKMTAEDQLRYVYKYFEPLKGKIHSLEDLYMAILWPKAMGKPLDYAMWSKGAPAYTVNKGLDGNKDGIVTKLEAAKKVREKLERGEQFRA